MTQAETKDFRELCVRNGIAVTHQRQVLYEIMLGMEGHPSPEEVYERVKQRISSISLATVYKNLHLFIGCGIFREVSLHHGSLRVEMNGRPHHHLVCTVCKTIADVDEDQLGTGINWLDQQSEKLPGGFLAERLTVDVLGRCITCQTKNQ